MRAAGRPTRIPSLGTTSSAARRPLGRGMASVSVRPAACMAGRMLLAERRSRPFLIVDDDGAIRAVERAVLAEEGFSVREAHNGAEALASLDADPPAMIVLDVNMPGVDGPTFARELRMRLRHVPLVIRT